MAAASMALVFTGVSGQPASADPRCNLEYVCAFQNDQWIVEDYNGVRSGDCIKSARWVNRMDNKTGYYQRMWTSENCSGTSFLVRPGEEITGPGVYNSIGGY